MDSPLALSIIGLAVILGTVGLLLSNRAHPVVAMTLVPVAGALIAGFGPSAIGEFFGSGLESVMNVVVMFVFAIVFFGMLSDAGFFLPVVGSLIRATKGRVLAAALGTAAIGIVAHLDGAGATTFLIAIPTLLPLYKALHMSRYVLLAILALSAGVMNMMPWAGPLGRAASVVDEDPVQLWHHLVPIQLSSIVVVFLIAALLGVLESRRIARLRRSPEFIAAGPVDTDRLAAELVERWEHDNARNKVTLRRGRAVTIANVALVVALLAVLLGGVVPPAPAFLVATAIALPLNFPAAKDQTAAIRRHAPAALAMAGVILAAAMFLGVLEETGMLEHIALGLLAVLPEAWGPGLHVIVGVLGVPLDLLTSTDAYYFSILPIVQETVAEFGVSGTGAAAVLIIGNIVGTFVSPFSPALWLAIGLAGANMGKHIKVTFPLAWAFGVIMVLAAEAFGLTA